VKLRADAGFLRWAAAPPPAEQSCGQRNFLLAGATPPHRHLARKLTAGQLAQLQRIATADAGRHQPRELDGRLPQTSSIATAAKPGVGIGTALRSNTPPLGRDPAWPACWGQLGEPLGGQCTATGKPRCGAHLRAGQAPGAEIATAPVQAAEASSDRIGPPDPSTQGSRVAISRWLTVGVEGVGWTDAPPRRRNVRVSRRT